jgi:hypothetical protein
MSPKKKMDLERWGIYWGPKKKKKKKREKFAIN